MKSLKNFLSEDKNFDKSFKGTAPLQESISEVWGQVYRTVKTKKGTEVVVLQKSTPYDYLYKVEWNFVTRDNQCVLRALTTQTRDKAIELIKNFEGVDLADDSDFLEALPYNKKL